MPRVVGLDPAAHRHLAVNNGVGWASDRRHVQIGVGEVVDAANDYAVVLLKDSVTGGFRLAALTGLAAPRNLYVFGETWHATWLPGNIVREPFCLIAAGETLLTGIDLDHPRVGGGALLFDADGQPTAVLATRQRQLASLQAGLAATTAFVARAVACGLVVPMALRLIAADGSDHGVDGLYTIGDDALAALPATELIALRDSGWLAASYAIGLSRGQLHRLQQLHNAHVADGWAVPLLARIEVGLADYD